MKHFKICELNRKINISVCLAAIILIMIFSIIFLFIYLKRNTVYYVHYDEHSNLDYNVNLKKNNYYEEKSLNKGKQYIASLIDSIDANFKYKLDVKEDLKYNYKYKITANVNVTDNNTNKSIYTISEDMLEEKTGESDGTLDINENVKINYNKYNNKISKFVKTYNLTNVTSKLTLQMYVGIDGDLKELNKDNTSVISLDIPLTTNTVAIDINYDLSNNVDNLITLKPSYQKSKIWLNIAIIMFVIDLGLLLAFIKYVIDTQTDEEKYNVQLKRILNNYGSQISKVEDEFDMKGYQILKVANFVDLLEIRDTMHTPIIMLENKEQHVTCFIIPTDNKLLYFYSLSINQYALPSGEDESEEYEEKVCTKSIK